MSIMQNSIRALQEQLAKLDREKNSLVEKIQKLDDERNALNTIVHEVTQDRDSARAALTNCRSDLAQTTALIQRLAQEHDEVVKDLETCQHDQSRAAALIAELAQDRARAVEATQKLGDDQVVLADSVQRLVQEREQLIEKQKQNEQERDNFLQGIVDHYAQTQLNRASSLNATRDVRDGTLSEQLAEIKRLLYAYDTPLNTLAVLELIPETHDDIYHRTLRFLYQQRLAGVQPRFWDLRIALNVLARVLRPNTYLEVGTRLGWSLAQVLYHVPTALAYSFDLWIENYALSDNPGKEFVITQMKRIIPLDVEFPLTLVSGNSHDTLIEFFDPQTYSPSFSLNEVPPQSFDLITVDGDHFLQGAWMDLITLLPHVAVGGAIVFDDLELSIHNSDIGMQSATKYTAIYPPLPQGVESLGDIWEAIKKLYPNFTFIESDAYQNSVGIGIRMS